MAAKLSGNDTVRRFGW